jgi:hypothetical protein
VPQYRTGSDRLDACIAHIYRAWQIERQCSRAVKKDFGGAEIEDGFEDLSKEAKEETKEL